MGLEARKGKLRSRMDIIASILSCAVEGPSSKTRIMYKASLSFRQLQRYLPLLLARKLIEKVNATGRYTLTKDGRNFLDAYKRLTEFVETDLQKDGRTSKPVKKKVKY